MDSVFRVSSSVSLTAWHCVGVQQPAVCVRASGRQQECVSPVMNGAQDAEACGRAASQGSPAPRGSPASGLIQTPTRGSRPRRQGCLALTRTQAARVPLKADGSSGVQRAELDGAAWGGVWAVLVCRRGCCLIALALSSLSLSLSAQLFR